MGGDFDRLWIGAGMQVRLPLGGGGVLALWVRGRKGWGKWLYGSKDFIGTLCVAGLGWGVEIAFCLVGDFVMWKMLNFL